MEYTLIDMDGSTLDVFEDLPAARSAVSFLLKEEPTAADELVVLAYAHNERVGPPILVRDLVGSNKAYLAHVIASYLGDWTPEINLGVSSPIDTSANLEIQWEAEEAEPDAEMLVQRPRLALC
jgi:hypothetical protein